MNFTGIFPEQGPKISIPFRFYFLAHLNIIIGFLYLFYKFFSESDFIKLLSFESHHFLILFHCFSIGFLLFIIFGSLFQMLPVVLGVIIKHNEFVSNFMIILLYLIYYLFSIYFVYFQHSLILGFIILIFIILIVVYFIIPLVKTYNIENPGFFLSLFSFIIGLSIIAIYFLNLNFLLHDINLFTIRRIHGIIMLIGFVQQLIISVTFQVIPMFYVSKNYPQIIKSILNYGYFFLSILILLIQHNSLIYFYIIFNLIYIITTINILLKRSRKLKDSTIKFFILGLILLFIISIILLVDFKYNYFSIILFLFINYILSFIYGMFYKIVPFLSWFHLQSIKNRKMFDLLKSGKDTNSLFFIQFHMSDFIIKKLENIHFIYFIICILFFITIKQFLFFYIIMILLFFTIPLIQLCYAIYKFKKILDKIGLTII
ncbi:MAG: hypothetical protein KatS3mg129_2628 [Leptospiraceae bacterium]|nr:MAG: hypothetical protein KatS3mg129_2628 [Leptospiraceae bacterium]